MLSFREFYIAMQYPPASPNSGARMQRQDVSPLGNFLESNINSSLPNIRTRNLTFKSTTGEITYSNRVFKSTLLRFLQGFFDLYPWFPADCPSCMRIEFDGPSE